MPIAAVPEYLQRDDREFTSRRRQDTGFFCTFPFGEKTVSMAANSTGVLKIVCRR